MKNSTVLLICKGWHKPYLDPRFTGWQEIALLVHALHIMRLRRHLFDGHGRLIPLYWLEEQWDGIKKRFTCACFRKFTSNVFRECERGDLVGVKHRVKTGFHLQKRNHVGEQIIHVAAIAGHAKIVRWCAKHPQGNVKATDAQGRTALWIACFYGHRQVMEALLPFENDISVTPWKGEFAGITAERLAKKNHCMDVIDNWKQLNEATRLKKQAEAKELKQLAQLAEKEFFDKSDGW